MLRKALSVHQAEQAAYQEQALAFPSTLEVVGVPAHAVVAAQGGPLLVAHPALDHAPSSDGLCQPCMAPVISVPASINQSIDYTFPALWLGVSKEIVCFCPPSPFILSQPGPRWQDPKGIQILSDIASPALHSCSSMPGQNG